MPLPASRFLDPEALRGIADLRLVARTVVHGFLAGQHLDARPGAGVEFSQYRGYQPGDDPRRIDWRVYGRSDRLVVREAEVERDVTVRFVLDASRSMAHRDGRGRADGDPSKLDYARALVASLAYLADLQGDRLACHVIRDGQSVDLPPAGGPRAFEHLLGLLEDTRAAGSWPPWRVLGPRVASRRGRELVVVVGDLYQHGDEMTAALRTLKACGHEVLVLHVMARNELDFTFAGDLVFEDLETGERVRADADALRQRYLERLAAHLDGWRRGLLELAVGYQLIALDEPLAIALRALLVRRRFLP